MFELPRFFQCVKHHLSIANDPVVGDVWSVCASRSAILAEYSQLTNMFKDEQVQRLNQEDSPHSPHLCGQLPPSQGVDS